MKSKLGFLLFFMCQLAISQQLTITGVILDKENDEPVYGASLLMGDNYLGFSDVEGVFSFNIEEKYSIETVTIKHLSYKDNVISVLELSQVSIITLMPKISSLDEVVIKANLRDYNSEDILKKGIKLFDKMYVDYPYWSKLDYKHILYLDGNPHAFMQLDGHILMVGSKVNNPFIDASVIPDHIRRTKESDLPVKSWFPNSNSNSFSKAQLGGNEAKNGWTDFRFVELIHPLSKQSQGYFDLSINNASNNNEDYIIIDFTQKKDINIATRWLDNMSGQIWLNKEDLTVCKLMLTYRFEKIFLITYDISYKQISEKLFPSIVKKTKYNFTPHNKEKSKITISSISKLYSINAEKRDNYRKKYIAPWYSFSEVYDLEYWKEKNIQDPKYMNGFTEILGNKSIVDIFNEGANTKEYNENLTKDQISNWEANGMELKSIMHKDLNL